MTNLKDHLQKYVDGWTRGACERDPKEIDEVSLRGHKAGLRARYRAIDLELEKQGVRAGPYTVASVSGSVEIDEDALDLAPSPITETETALSPVAESPDPMLEHFTDIRARHLYLTDVPSGLAVPHEWETVEGPTERRIRPQAGAAAVAFKTNTDATLTVADTPTADIDDRDLDDPYRLT